MPVLVDCNCDNCAVCRLFLWPLPLKEDDVRAIYFAAACFLNVPRKNKWVCEWQTSSCRCSGIVTLVFHESVLVRPRFVLQCKTLNNTRLDGAADSFLHLDFCLFECLKYALKKQNKTNSYEINLSLIRHACHWRQGIRPTTPLCSDKKKGFVKMDAHWYISK